MVFISVSLLALGIRYFLLPFESYDYKHFLLPWFEQLKGFGGLPGLKYDIGNYAPPYLTILALLTYLPVGSIYSIKFVSILFDFVSAVAAAKIVLALGNEHNKKTEWLAVAAYTVVLMLPTVVVNSAMWGQCDGIYCAFLMLCVLYIIKERHFKAFVFFGLALAFKLQAVFLLPALAIYWLRTKKFSLKYFLLIPAVWAVSLAPAIVAGRPLSQTAGIYFGQAASNTENLSNHYPNFSVLLKDVDVSLFTILLTLFTMAVLLAFLIVLQKKKFNPSGIDFVGICVWCAFVCVMFLPGMHERYAYIVEVLSVVYMMVRRGQWVLAAGINAVGAGAYITLKFYIVNALLYLSIANLLLFCVFTFQIFRSFFLETANAVQIKAQDESL